MAHRDDEFDEYVEESPEPPRNTQRLLIIILSVGCLALAISNVVLATRVTQLRRTAVVERPAAAPTPTESAAAPPPPTTESAEVSPAPIAKSEAVPPPSAERRAVARRQSTERAAVPERQATEVEARAVSPASERPTSEPPGAAASIPSPPPPASDPAPRPTAEVATPAPESAKAELPARVMPREQARVTPREQARVAVVTRATDRVIAAPMTPERATATWMVQEYGRAAAESRARSVADFYGTHSPDGAYWRRVLAEIVAARR